VLHGLRTLLGADVVDIPKPAHLYAGAADQVAKEYGRGFTMSRLLPEVDIERPSPRRALDQRNWDLLVVGSPWYSVDVLRQAVRLHPRTPVIILDGHDRSHVVPHSLRLRAQCGPRLPRADRDAIYCKRELSSESAWLRWYRVLPRPLFRKPPRGLHPIAFAIPEEKIVTDPPTTKAKDFPRHVVDPEVSAAVGATTAYAFDDEEAYYADLRASRWGITTKRRGWDCMRHYEIAANGAVPCFRDLTHKEQSCAPHGLIPGHNCIAYGSFADLQRQIHAIDKRRYAVLQGEALAWARANTTRRRATQVLALAGVTASADHVPDGEQPQALGRPSL
jgi:hypothetical protein